MAVTSNGISTFRTNCTVLSHCAASAMVCDRSSRKTRSTGASQCGGVGDIVGDIVGLTLGHLVGEMVGDVVGLDTVGLSVGATVGDIVLQQVVGHRRRTSGSSIHRSRCAGHRSGSRSGAQTGDAVGELVVGEPVGAGLMPQHVAAQRTLVTASAQWLGLQLSMTSASQVTQRVSRKS